MRRLMHQVNHLRSTLPMHHVNHQQRRQVNHLQSTLPMRQVNHQPKHQVMHRVMHLLMHQQSTLPMRRAIRQLMHQLTHLRSTLPIHQVIHHPKHQPSQQQEEHRALATSINLSQKIQNTQTMRTWQHNTHVDQRPLSVLATRRMCGETAPMLCRR